jgi:GNAT superfamily N-acetyltransferase
VSDDLVWTTYTSAEAAPLIADLGREYDARYGGQSSVELQRYPAERFDPEHGGAFLVIVRDGVTIAGGAYMRFDDESAEVKRMWTHADHRRQGLAGRVLGELEQRAKQAGYRGIVLTTGARQPEAVALYLALGYEAQFDVDGDWEEVDYLAFRKPLD